MPEAIAPSTAPWLFTAVLACFVWSGFVRSSLGFGGAALTLPLLLMVVDDPLVFLPTICWQLLFFSGLTVATRSANVDLGYLARLAGLLALPFVAGLLGLLNLPGSWLSLLVYTITLIYGIAYALDRTFHSESRIGDAACLVVGGYVSGVSLIGAPLIVAYSTGRLPPERLRDTLFVMWIALVIVKLGTFVVAEVPMHWWLTIVTFPFAALGHWLGLKLHVRLLRGEGRAYPRLVGAGLAAVSVAGLVALVLRIGS